MRAKRAAVAGAPAFLVAAAAATFAFSPAQAKDISADSNGTVAEGDYDSGSLEISSLTFASGNITVGGDASIELSLDESTTKLSSSSNVTFDTTGTIFLAKVDFSSASSAAGITVKSGEVSMVSLNGGNDQYGTVNVTGGSLDISGDVSTIAAVSVSGSGTVSIDGKAGVGVLTVGEGGTANLTEYGAQTLSMQGGKLSVSKNFAIATIKGANENDASGTISVSGEFTVSEDNELIAENLNLETTVDGDKKGSIVLSEGSTIDLGKGSVTLAEGTSLKIGTENSTEKTESLTATKLTAGTDATVALNGGSLELTADNNTQSLDALTTESTGTVSVSGENSTAKFTSAKTFGALDISAENGTVEVDGAAVSTEGNVVSKNLTIGNANSSIKAKSFTLSDDGTLSMSGGTLDLSATEGATDIYAVADNSSGEITEGDTTGEIVFHKSVNAGELDISAENGTVTLDNGTGEAIEVSTTGEVSAATANVGANTLVGKSVTISDTDKTGSGLALDGGSVIGDDVKIYKIREADATAGTAAITGTIAGQNDGSVELDLPKDNGFVATGEITLGGKDTKTVKISGNGTLTLAENSTVSATGTTAGTDGLIVGADDENSLTFNHAATGTTLNANAVFVGASDTLKLSGDQTLGGYGDGNENVAGTIKLGTFTKDNDTKTGTITTTGSLTALGDVTMQNGLIELTGKATTEDPNAGKIALGKITDQGTVAGETLEIGSVSDSETNKVVLAGKSDGSTAAKSLTFTGTGGKKTSNISANAASVVSTEKLALSDDVSVTIGNETNKAILAEENLKTVELGANATLSTETDAALDKIESATLGASAAWTHNNSDLTITEAAADDAADALSLGDSANLTVADGKLSVTGTTTAGDSATVSAQTGATFAGTSTFGANAKVSSATGDVSFDGTTSFDEKATVTATTGKISFDASGDGESTTFGDSATVSAKTGATFAGTSTFGASAKVSSATGNVSFDGTTSFGDNATVTATAGKISFDASGEDESTTFGDSATVSAQTGATFAGTSTFGANAKVSSATGNVSFDGTTSFDEKATVTATDGKISFDASGDGESTTLGDSATVSAKSDITAKGNLTVNQNGTLTSSEGKIDLSEATLKLRDVTLTTKAENAQTATAAHDILLGAIDQTDPLSNATVDSAHDVVLAQSGTATLNIKAKNDLVVKENANFTIVNGVIDQNDTLLKNTKLEAGATLDLRGNGFVKGEGGTPISDDYNLATVSLGDGATLSVGGENPSTAAGETGDNYPTYATADSVANADANSTGKITVNGATASEKISTLTVAGTIGDTTKGGVSIELNDSGKIVAQGTDNAGVGIYVAEISGNGGGDLIAQTTGGDTVTKNDIYITASNATAEEISFTADELRVTDLTPTDDTNVSVTLKSAHLENIEKLTVTDASGATDSKTHSTLTLSATETSVKEIQIGETTGTPAATNSGALVVSENSAISTDKLTVLGENSSLEISSSSLTAKEIADPISGTLSLDNGTLTATTGDIVVEKALADNASGTLDAVAGNITFKNGAGSSGALTLNATVSRDETTGEINGSTGTLTFEGTGSTLGENSVVNAKKIVATADADLANADVNFLTDVSVSDGAKLSTAEDFIPAERNGKGVLNNVSIENGTFKNAGALEISGNGATLKLGKNADTATDGTLSATGDITIAANLVSTDETGTTTARGTISGTNVEIDLSKQASNNEFTENLKLSANDKVWLHGDTGTGEEGTEKFFKSNAIISADSLQVGGDDAGSEDVSLVENDTATRVEITNANDALAGVSGIGVNDNDTLKITGDWTPSQESLNVNLGDDANLLVAGKMTLGADKSLAVEGSGTATIEKWADVPGASIRLTGAKDDDDGVTKIKVNITGETNGTTTFNSKISAYGAALTVENGNLEIAGGNGETTVHNFDIATSEVGKSVSFKTKDFAATGLVTITTTADNDKTDAVNFESSVSLGEKTDDEDGAKNSVVKTSNLNVAATSESSVAGTIAVEKLALKTDASGNGAALTLSGEHDSTVAHITDGTNEDTIAAGATLALTGKQKLTLSAGTDASDKLTVAGTLEISDYATLVGLENEGETLTVSDGGNVSLESGATLAVGTLDLSAAGKGALTIVGNGTDGDSAELTAGTLSIGNTAGTAQLSNGGKMTVDQLAAGSSVTLTQADGDGNIWTDEASQFVLKKGDLTVTEDTRGEIVAENGTVNFDGKTFELSGIGTEKLVSQNNGNLGQSSTLDFTISEYNDANATENENAYTYSHVDIRGETNLKNTTLSIADIARNADSDANDVAVKFGSSNTKFDASTVSVSGTSNDSGYQTTVKAEGGITLGSGSTLTLSNAKLTGGDVAVNNSTLALNDASVLDANATIGDGSTLSTDGGFQIADGKTVTANSGATISLGGDVSGEGTLAANGASIEITTAAESASVSNLEISNSVSVSGEDKALVADTLTLDDAGASLNYADGTLAAENLSLNGGTISAKSLEIANAENASGTLSATDELAIEGTVSNDPTKSLEISAGSVDIADEASLTLSGKNAELTADTVDVSGTLTLDDGATVTGDITLNDSASGANVSVTDSTVNGDITLNGGVDDKNTLKIEGASTVSGTISANDGIIAISKDANVGGIDANSSAIVTQLMESDFAFDELTIDKDFVGDGTTTGLYVDDGKTLSVDKLSVVNGGTLAVEGTVADKTAGAEDNYFVADGEGTKVIVKGTGVVEKDLTATDGATVSSAGTLENVSLDNATFTQTAGKAGDITATNGSTLSLEGTAASVTATGSTVSQIGDVSGDVSLTNGTGETPTELNGDIGGALTLDNSSATLAEGKTVTGATTLTNSASLESAGTLEDVSLDSATFTQTAGTAGDITATNGSAVSIAGSAETVSLSDSTAEISGEVENLNVASGATATVNTVDGVSAATVSKDGELVVGESTISTDISLEGGTISGTNFEIKSSLEDAEGTISANELTLNDLTDGADGVVIKADSVQVNGTVDFDSAASGIDADTISVAGTLTANNASLDATDLTVEDGGTLSVDELSVVNGGSLVVEGTVSDKTEGEGSFTADGEDTQVIVKENGTVEKDLTATNGATVSSEGTLADVSLNGSTFTQTAGTAGDITATNGSTVSIAGTAGDITATNSSTLTLAGSAETVSLSDSTAEISGTVEKLTVASGATATVNTVDGVSAATVSKDGELVVGESTISTDISLEGGTISGTNFEIKSSLEDAEGTITADNSLTLNGLTDGADGVVIDVAGFVQVKGDVELKSADSVIDADKISVVGTLTANDASLEVESLNVEDDGTLNLTVDSDTVFVATVYGTANLIGDDAFEITGMSGDGAVYKEGAGALTLGDNAEFSGALEIAAGDVSLSAGSNFGGDVSMTSAGTFTGGNGAGIAGTLALASGSTLEIADRTGAGKLTLGGLETAQTLARSSGTLTVVHDLYENGTIDVLAISGTNVDLSGVKAVVRSNLIDENSLLGKTLTLTLVEGDVANGYGTLASEGFTCTNLHLSDDGKSVVASLNWKAASSIAASSFNPNQRAVASALNAVESSATGRLAEYLGENGLGATNSVEDSAKALDDLGALHTVAMMPAQIDATWNHVKSVRNAIGTGAFLDYQHGKPNLKYGAWVQAVYSDADIDGNSKRQDWDRSMSGATAGFEYAASKNLLAGVAVGYENSELKSNGNKAEDSAYHVDFYAKHRMGAFEQRGIFSLGFHDYDIDRTIRVGSLGDSVSGSTDGFTVALSYDAAYNFKVAKWLTLAPAAQISVAFNTIDGWDESGAGTASLSYDDQTAFTGLVGVGGRASVELPNASYPGAPIRFDAYAMLTAEVGNRSCDVDAKFSGTGTGFTMSYDDPKAYALDIGVSAAVPLTNRVAIFGGISTEIREDESGFNANAGVRIGW